MTEHTTGFCPDSRQGSTVNVASGREVKLILTNFSERDAVIVKAGDHVTFVSAVMAVDKPYVFPFLGKWHVTVKREDGSMDVYAVPDAYRSMLKRLSRRLRGRNQEPTASSDE